MSHLPLESKAILQYLNELGYWNISAEQLTEFMKGMLSQSEVSGNRKLKSKGDSHRQLHQSAKPAFANNIKPTDHHHSRPLLQQQQQQQQVPVKVIKSSTPLQNFHFYLDVCDHPSTKRIEEQIELLGGRLEFLLTTDVTHFITDRKTSTTTTSVTCRPGTPQTPLLLAHTPTTPTTTAAFYCSDVDVAAAVRNDNCAGTSNAKTPLLSSARATRNSRADAILNRARRQCNLGSPPAATVAPVITPATTAQTQTRIITTDTIDTKSPIVTIVPEAVVLAKSGKTTDQQILCNRGGGGGKTSSNYIVWNTEYAFRFFKKVQHQLKDYLTTTTVGGVGGGGIQKSSGITTKTPAVEPIALRGGFIKIEALKNSHRPYYHRFKKPTEWPKIELTRDDGAFRLASKKTLLELKEAVGDQQQPLSNALLNCNMTRKSRSRSSQCVVQQHQSPALPGCSLQQQSRPREIGNDADIKNFIPTTSSHQNQQQQQQQNLQRTVGVVPTAKESTDKQCGVCEICKIEYDTLTIHLKTKGHQYFVKNSQNFLALDTLIQTSADVGKFLEKDKQQLCSRDGAMEIEMSESNEEVMTEYVGNTTVQRSTRRRSSGTTGQKTLLSSSSSSSASSSSTTPSALTLREKSSRTTKGKHSSEKFRTELKLKTPPKPAQQDEHSTTTAVLLLRSPTSLQPPGTPNTRNKQAPGIVTSTLSSPPIRAMLPPSSLYKVVETTPPDCALQQTPSTRGGLANARSIVSGGTNAIGSPSLIVKFKKVRQTELLRLNGEAENFIYPKRRTSSDLPTDIDRQTTTSESSSSNGCSILSSSSVVHSATANASIADELEKPHDDDNNCQAERFICSIEDTPSTAVQQSLDDSTSGRKIVAAVAKRSRKDDKDKAKMVIRSTQQSFQIAPIQPGIQLKRLRHTNTSITTGDTINYLSGGVGVAGEDLRCSSIVNMRCKSEIVDGSTGSRTTVNSIAVPEATRKSSRMATAIVTAATTSSRLLRAAVAAAKHSGRCRRMIHKHGAASLTNDIVLSHRANSHLTVVRKEDRMGDNDNDDDNDEEDDENDDDDNDYEESHNNDSGNDSANELESEQDSDNTSFRWKKSERNLEKPITAVNKLKRTMPSQRITLRRRKRKKVLNSKNETAESDEENEDEDEDEDGEHVDKSQNKNAVVFPIKSARVMCLRGFRSDIAPKNNVLPKKAKKTKQRNRGSNSSPQQQQMFDIKNSERLQRTRYAFERIPAADLWYRVFVRQDNCQERFFEYYGSRSYRKLPYELGPVPFQNAQCSQKNCRLCHFQHQTPAESKDGTTRLVGVQSIEPKSELQTHESNIVTDLSAHIKSEKDETNVATITTGAAIKYTQKHKKTHLLQRYHQEQQDLLKQQQLQSVITDDCDNLSSSAICLPASSMSRFNSSRPASKASTPERERSGSTYSTASSCASSSTMNCHKKHYRNKLLNLELPPRKSPREHASTLALVCGIIRQRQDSQSKAGSEIDEPSTQQSQFSNNITMPTTSIPAIPPMQMNSNETIDNGTNNPTETRSTVITPVEELRFTTEISENVKRMRRGQNKYDHSPPFILPTSNRSRSQRYQRNFDQNHRCPSTRNSPLLVASKSQSPANNIKTTVGKYVNSGKVAEQLPSRCKRKSVVMSTKSSSTNNAPPSIRKTGSRKGVLEFEMDEKALKALQSAASKVPSVFQLEREIHRHLLLTGREYDDLTITPPSLKTAQSPESIANRKTVVKELNTRNSMTNYKFARSQANADGQAKGPTKNQQQENNTPPPTDCFSSEFDLCDLFTQPSQSCGFSTTAEHPNHERWDIGKRNGFSLYNSVALQNYFRRRKNLKSNRTGWPKMQKKKTSLRQQQLQQKIRFLPLPFAAETNANAERELQKNSDDEVTQNRVTVNCKVNGCSRGVITPPDSENEAKTALRLGAEMKIEQLAVKHCHSSLNHDASQQGVIKEEKVTERRDEYSDMDQDDDDDDDDNDDVDPFLNIDRTVLTVPIAEDDESNAYAASQSTIDEEEPDKISEYNEVLVNDTKKIDVNEEDDAELIDGAVDDDEDDDDNNNDDDDEDEDDEDEEPTEEEDVDDGVVAYNQSPSIRANTVTRNGKSISPRMKTTCNDKLYPLKTLVVPTTSTPSVQLLRGLRRTPQLNGSLGSCVSPSEKAGDNSDIFTVSSDGLDTDLDMSNPHSQHQQRADDESHEHSTTNGGNPYQTPKRKFDLSKYAPKNNVTCASEAATAAVKSLAISQFLKKEVRVTCRRLRAPFRRFRYRR